MDVFTKSAVAGMVALGAAGCASDPIAYSQMPREHGHALVENDTHKPLQCVPYARAHSAIKLYGDAYTWWDQAVGKYQRGPLPEPGSVMVLDNYAGPTRGHVAVVRRLVSPREIRVDHANWLDDGAIYVNNPVEDVSQDNDWSSVRIYNLQTGGWGSRVYPVQGFIGGKAPATQDDEAVAGGGSGATALVGDIN